ncbi:hypothetical protein AB0D84_10470, partial [Streptomyces sp. NPDC048193]
MGAQRSDGGHARRPAHPAPRTTPGDLRGGDAGSRGRRSEPGAGDARDAWAASEVSRGGDAGSQGRRSAESDAGDARDAWAASEVSRGGDAGSQGRRSAESDA